MSGLLRFILLFIIMSIMSCSKPLTPPSKKVERSQRDPANEVPKNSESNIVIEPSDPNSSTIWFATAATIATIAKDQAVNTEDPNRLNVDFCHINPNSKIEISERAELIDSNTIYVYLDGVVSPDCPLREGVISLLSITSISHELIRPENPSKTPTNPPKSDIPGTDPSFESPAVLDFPLPHKPYQSFLSAPRNFGAIRDGGRRTHAAADLYSDTSQPVMAIADGRVIDYYYFYSGTYAVVVEHPEVDGMKIVRYGEVGSLASGVKVGDIVKRGQILANVGKLSCCSPMLHFEGYTGTASGPLSVSSGKYRRRSDLLNPTDLLLELQAKAFP